MRIRAGNHHIFTGETYIQGGGIHPYYELLHIESGKFVLEWMGVEYTAPAPCLYLLTPNTPHNLMAISSSLSFWYIELELDDLSSFVAEDRLQSWNRLQSDLDYNSIELRGLRRTLEEISEVLLWRKQKPVLYDEEILVLDVQKIVRYIHHYFREQQEDLVTKTSIETTIRALMRSMESKYFQNIELEDLSTMVHYNSSYLARAFKNIAGMTPMQYLNKLRLNAAVSYLANTEMPVHVIAEATGFNSIHYFSRLFKKTYGLSPIQWRNAHRK